MSVLGVYKDGQMSAEAWDALVPRLSPWLPGARCRAGYDDASAAGAGGPLWSAIDDYTRSNGPTDDLLSRIAPAARGDLVLVFTVAGKLTPEKAVTVEDATKNGVGTVRGGPTLRSRGSSVPAGSVDALDLSALVYSVTTHESVATVSLRYEGHSLDDALARFAGKLHDSLPGVDCAGWNWSGTVEASAIRNLGDGT